ncbi:MAG: DUF4301 family protein [Thermodesulfobacteriota bacterium]|nr:DUF4301 family protein [Thermodesulfobacteriota bacterium]
MDYTIFSPNDIKQISTLGITEEQVRLHIDFFRKKPSYLKLNRPCTIGDGIRTIQKDEIQNLIAFHEDAARKGRLLKFVPASGAASRMFKVLLQFKELKQNLKRVTIAKKAKEKDKILQEMLLSIDGIKRFAFWNDLKSVMKTSGIDIENHIDKDYMNDIIDFLLSPRGLNYANLPKGLLKFHQYSHCSRTAFEEHLVEAADYVRDAEGICRLHLTISSEHKEKFDALLEEIRPRYEQKYKVNFHVGFSIQKRSTDTIAVDLHNQPFREKDGTLVFRPGGHGTLIENLNTIDGDIIFIKNIDNVVPDRLKYHTFLWKKILAGYLIKNQQRIFEYLEKMTTGKHEESSIEEILNFTQENLIISPPYDWQHKSSKEQRDFLIHKLNRPIRVCGVVKNEGEPGGAPFWVEEKYGTLSLQIVESAQIDQQSEKQRAILNSATHFNPVDIVCGIKDFRGNSFDLRKYIDSDAVFITQKSKEGRDLKALEVPGLWNGAMADWITIFVEVPIITFNPVKTINDLLRKEHQP